VLCELDELMVPIHFNHLEALWLFATIPIMAAAAWQSRAGLRPGGRIAVACIRTIALAAGIVALAEPVAEIPTVLVSNPKLYVLQDRSLSVGSDPASDAIASATIAAAGIPAERILFAGGNWRPNERARETDQTDIEAALDAVLSAPGERFGDHVVVITDGRSTRGSAVEAATRLALRGAKVHVVPIGMHRDEPTHIVAIEPPLGARVGVPTGLHVTLSADSPGAATVRLLDPRHRIIDQRIIPLPGKPTLILHFTPTEGGLRDYSIEADVSGRLADSRNVPIYVEGPPRILLVDNVPDEAFLLSKAIGELQMPVDVVAPDRCPDDLGPYAAIVMSDLSGKEFTPDQRGNLRRFVEIGGGGLVFIGGSNTVASRWKDNPLSELLPIRLREQPAKVIKKLPDISVVFVLDCSGSMAEHLPGSAGDVSKLEMVKAAAIASLQSMPETTQVSLIAFDSSPSVIVPPTPIDRRQEIAAKIDAITCGGSTDMFPAVAQGLSVLDGMKGDKYLVVLTDGVSDDPPPGSTWQNLSDAAVAGGISWTSVGVGADADENLLREIATRAGGRYAFCGTGDQIPKVFIEQAKAIRRISEVKQEPFFPRTGPDVADLSIIRSASLPELQGCNLADARPDAHVLLVNETNGPLLASWQFGAGKVFAFCSDAKNLWAKSWLGAPIFPNFWAGIVASVARPHEPLHATVRTSRQGNHFILSYRVRDENDHFVEELDPHIAIDPKILTVPVWQRPRPGDYEVSFDLPADDRPYDIDVLLQAQKRGSVHHHSMLAGATGLELAATGPDVQACEEIAAAGLGVCSIEPNIIAAAVRTRPPDETFLLRKPLWRWPAAVMILIWPIDVLLRKVL
jgi:Mg-chelatase subunit ChlD